jgi:branched-chain amino acid aminotransferase
VAIVVSIDGVLVPPSDARVSVFDRGFLYGDSVFETIRTYSGRPFALDKHLSRLERSAELVFIPLPVSKSQLEVEIGEALKAAGNDQSYIRVMVTRGQGELGLDPALAEVPRRVIIVGPLSAPPASLYEEGVAVVTFHTERPSDSTPAEGAKIGNYLVAVLAVRAARAAGAHEALITANDGTVLEGASSNVFIVEGERLVTPSTDLGILAGITREHVLLAASELAIEVTYEAPSVARLRAADEVFISSSIRELLPVVKVDGYVVGGGRPGPVTRRLYDGFRALVRSEMGL